MTRDDLIVNVTAQFAHRLLLDGQAVPSDQELCRRAEAEADRLERLHPGASWDELARLGGWPSWMRAGKKRKQHQRKGR